MDPWKDAAEIIQKVKAWEWTPELFERCRNNTLISPGIFNLIRRELTPEEYTQFDTMYCEYIRPGQKQIAQYIRQKRGEKDWKEKKKALLKKKRRLLIESKNLMR